MSRRPKKQAPESAASGKQYRWAIYHITGTPAKLLGHVEAPDEESAIKQAIEEFGITNPSAAETAACTEAIGYAPREEARRP